MKNQQALVEFARLNSGILNKQGEFLFMLTSDLIRIFLDVVVLFLF